MVGLSTGRGRPLSMRKSTPTSSGGGGGYSLWQLFLALLVGLVLGHFQAHLTQQIVSNQQDCSGAASHSAAVATSPLKLQHTKEDKGWHSIDVFYGDSNHLERSLPRNKEWFAQASQDEAVLALLRGKKNGYFVDLAANDATILSNTYSLERHHGWTGLCIEPNPVYWANLTYRDCQVVAAVVGSKRMEQVHFRFDAGDHSGIVGFDNGERWRKSATPRYTVTLQEILQRYQTPPAIDYLSLDVEGAEEFIMSNFPLDKYKISILTVERPKPSLRELLEKNGFQFLMRLSRWGETLWAHQSVVESLDTQALQRFDPKLLRAQGKEGI